MTEYINEVAVKMLIRLQITVEMMISS